MSDTDIAQDEISLMDIAVVIAENWIFLVIVPLIAGAAAYFGLPLMEDKPYRSEAILQIDAREAASFSSATVLDAPIMESGLFNANTQTLSTARQTLINGQLSVSAIGNTDLYRVSLTSTSSPEQTQQLLNAIINSAIANSSPTGLARGRMELQAEQLASSIDALQGTLRRVNSSISDTPIGGEGVAGEAMTRDIGQSAVSIIEGIELRRLQLFNIQAEMEGSISESDVVQSATLPDAPERSSSLMPALLVVLGTGFIALIVAFIAEGFRNARRNPNALSKLNRIRRAFWLKPISGQ